MCNTSEHAEDLRKILLINNQDEKLNKLEELAKKVGANSRYFSMGQYQRCYVDLLVDRINDALRTNSMVLTGRYARLSVIAAIVSSIIALLSAIAAWIAVLYN